MSKVIQMLGNHKKKVIAAILGVIVLSGIYQVVGSRGGEEIPVITGQVIEDKFQQSVFATGILEVNEQKDIFAKISSYVEEITVKPGEKVQEGQLIMKMESDDLLLKVAEAQAAFDAKQIELFTIQSNIMTTQKEYEITKKDLERKKTLFEMGAISENELEMAEQAMFNQQESLALLQKARLPLVTSQLQETALILEKAKSNVEKASVTSPIDGTVLSIGVKEGHPVQMSQLLASIGTPEQLRIETGINEVDAAELQVGNKVEITSEGLFDKPVIGHIEYVAPIAQIERTSQGEQTQVKIRIAVDSVDNSKLKPGYNVNLKIIVAEKEKVILVPYEALLQKEGKDVVFVVDTEGIVSARELKLGMSNALFFEVIEGLAAGESVVLNPTENIKEGAKVKVNDKNRKPS
ncbi:MAG: efflux RND transporter periplasmic adaptor subunit [Bacillota bacterium]